MKHKETMQYFLNGFSVANRSFDILLIEVLLMLPLLLSSFSSDTTAERILGLFIIILVLQFIDIGLVLSMPFLLNMKQKSKTLDYDLAMRVLLKNTKRLILPGILLGFILIFLAVLANFIVETTKLFSRS